MMACLWEIAIDCGSSNTVDLSKVVVDSWSGALNEPDSYFDPAKDCSSSCEIVTLKKVWANVSDDGWLLDWDSLCTSLEEEDHPFGHAGPIPVPAVCSAYPSGSNPSPGVIDPSAVSTVAEYKACVDHLDLGFFADLGWNHRACCWAMDFVDTGCHHHGA